MKAPDLVRPFFPLGILALAGAAAASPARRPLVQEPPTGFDSPGRLGLVAFSSAAQVNLVMPLNSSEAVAAAALSIRQASCRQLGETAAVGAMGGAPGLLAGSAVAVSLPVLVPVVSGLGATAQAVHGSLAAEAEADLAPARATLAQALRDVRLEVRLRDRLLADLSRSGSPLVVAVDDRLVRATDPDLAARAWRNDVELRPKTRAALLQRNLATVLEIRIHSPALLGRSPLDPNLALTAQARIRIIETRTGREWHRTEIPYRSPAHPYRAWAAADAELLRVEIDRCVDAFAGAAGRSVIAHLDAGAGRRGWFAASLPDSAGARW